MDSKISQAHQTNPLTGRGLAYSTGLLGGCGSKQAAQGAGEALTTSRRETVRATVNPMASRNYSEQGGRPVGRMAAARMASVRSSAALQARQ